MAVSQLQHVSWLEDAAKDALSRAGTFEWMRKCYTVGDYARKHCDFADFLSICHNDYTRIFGVAIPEELVKRVISLYRENDELGLGIYPSGLRLTELRVSLAPQPYIEFFERCRDVQMELHQILVNQIKEQSGNQN